MTIEVKVDKPRSDGENSVKIGGFHIQDIIVTEE